MKMPNFLVISGHDYRSARKTNVHFITAELAKRGEVCLFSLGFSAISKLRGRDPRLGLEKRANKIERVEGIDCYLWWTPLHPGNLKYPILREISPVLFNLYKAALPTVFSKWAAEADIILVESGIGVILIEEIVKNNPRAIIIYLASDDMETIGVDPCLLQVFERASHMVHGARVPSKRLAATIPRGPSVYYVPHGVDPELDAHGDPSPYDDGINAVSIGSMLFDPSFFHTAVKFYPNIKFHVIGSGAPRSSLPEAVIYHDEMPFLETLPYLKHARFGIAPYRQANVPYYLADTSMKLMQYDHFGLPSVCPHFVVGDNHPFRFGYTPGDPESMRRAIQLALESLRNDKTSSLNWAEVVDRILDPSIYPDTAI